MPPRNRRLAAWLGALAALAAGVAAWALADGGRDKPALGLLTTLPIYWGETLEIGEVLDSPAPAHWARAALEEDFRLLPLDTLDKGGEETGSETGARGLAGLDRLLLAQPRALAPAENVALDDWVRGGGRLLVFADPFLTGRSRFAIGDRRRPQDVVLLSPILRRWGLELQFDPDQPAGERFVDIGGATLPIDLAGSFAAIPTEAPARCAVEAGGLIADCRIGEGRALVVADAALLDRERGAGAAPTLATLAERAFGQ